MGNQTAKEKFLPLRFYGLFPHLDGEEIIDESQKDDQKKVLGLIDHIEKVTGTQKKDPPDTVGDGKIDDTHEGEKEKEG